MAKKESSKTDKALKTTDRDTGAGIEISEDVVGVIAGKAIADTPGVYEMAGGIAGGISEVLSGKKNFSKGIRVNVDGTLCIIDVNIIVEYGSRIPDVAFDIQNRVKTAVEKMTGLKVEEVNVHVQGVNTDNRKDIEEKKITKKESAKKKTTTKKTKK